MNIAASILYSLAVLSFLLFGYYYLGYRSRKKEWIQKVKEWFPEEQRKSMVSKWGDRFDERESSKALEAKLQNANVKLLPSEYFGALLVGGLTLFILFYAIFNMPIAISILLPLFLMIATHFLLFYLRKNNYEKL